MLIGYARVSSDGQSLESQLELLKSAGCVEVFQEKASGKNRTGRRELPKLLRRLSRGDVLVVTRLDRLARSTRDLLNILEEVAEKGSGFKALSDAWCDTTSAHGKLMVTILGGLAEFERALLLARTAEGRHQAKRMGVRFGRKPKLSRYQHKEALERREAGETLKAIARSYGVSAPTILRLKPIEDRA